ncbi:hypothetical protein ACFQYP_50275 [Nonomuraea antimicrobica]
MLVAERGLLHTVAEDFRDGVEYPGQGPSLQYGLIIASWSKPRMYAPAAEKTMEYSSPEPVRIEAISSPEPQSESKEW